MSRPERIGILGGTFDPVHVGHLVAAVNVRHELGLDRVLLVVANQPWQKVAERPVSPAADRLAVVEAAVGDVDGVEASAIEIERGGLSYSADTVATIAAESPLAEIFLILGADAASSLSTWERLDELRTRVTLVIVNRPGTAGLWSHVADAPTPTWRVLVVEVPALDISSTDLRSRALDGRPLDYLVPAAAIREILARGLYALER